MSLDSSYSTIAAVHPVLARSKGLSWASMETPAEVLVESRESFVEAVESMDSESVSVERGSVSGVPVASVSVEGLYEETEFRVVLDSFGAEVYAPRPAEESGVAFDVVVPPVPVVGAVGAIGGVARGQSSQASQYVTVTGALRRAGIAVGGEVRLAARSGEVVVWPAEQSEPVYAAGRPVGGGRVSAPSSRAVSAFEQSVSGSVTDVQRTRGGVVPEYTMTVKPSQLPGLQFALASASVEVREVSRVPVGASGSPGLVVTVEMREGWSVPGGRRERDRMSVRKTNERSVIITMTNALVSAGLSDGEAASDAGQVAVFARPGELRVVRAAPNDDPVGLSDSSHE
jgi:hypothetical protein